MIKMKKNLIALTLFAVGFLAIANISLAAGIIVPPPSAPETKADCKKGGWMNYGGMFKNQGDCVSFVATNGKNLPVGQD